MEIERSETELLSGIVYFLRRKKQCRRLQISPILWRLEQRLKSQIRCELTGTEFAQSQIRCEEQKIGGSNVRNKKIGCPQKCDKHGTHGTGRAKEI